MRLTPKSTVRLSTFFAFSRSGGHPQIPSPVRRIAPNPSRLTVRSPPIFQVELALAGEAFNIAANPPVKRAAAPAALTRTKTRRETVSDPCASAAEKESLILDGRTAEMSVNRGCT